MQQYPMFIILEQGPAIFVLVSSEHRPIAVPLVAYPSSDPCKAFPASDAIRVHG